MASGAKAVVNDAELAARGGAVLKAAFGERGCCLSAGARFGREDC